MLTNQNMLLWNKFKYEIFDIDGTIIDIVPVYRIMFSRLLKNNFVIPENISALLSCNYTTINIVLFKSQSQYML